MRALGQDGGWRAGAKQATLTSSPQSVPQLFLMAQKGVAEPGSSAESRGSGPQALCTLQTSAVGLLCARY